MPATIASTVKFNPTGGTLWVELKFDTLLLCTYDLLVREAGSNATILREAGDNTNAEDDRYALPMPASVNANRVLWAILTVVDQTGAAGKYKLSMEISQDGTLLGTIATSSRKIDANSVTETLVARLVA